MNIGYSKRSKRRVHVKKGFDISENSSLDRAAPVKSGEDIKSGMVIVLDAGEWVIADSATPAHNTQVPYIALSDAIDTDVQASGLLPALSCAGDYEIETGYFDGVINETDTITFGTAATAGHIVGGATLGSDSVLGYATTSVVDLGRSGGLPVRDNTASDVKVVSFQTSFQPAQ